MHVSHVDVRTEHEKAGLVQGQAVLPAPVEGVPLVPGAVTAGPSVIGGFDVVGKLASPDGYVISGDRHSVVSKVLQPGEAFQCDDGRVDRKSLFIVSKLAKYNAGYARAKAAIGRTLRELGIATIDLMLIHHPAGGNSSTEVDPCISVVR